MQQKEVTHVESLFVVSLGFGRVVCLRMRERGNATATNHRQRKPLCNHGTRRRYSAVLGHSYWHHEPDRELECERSCWGRRDEGNHHGRWTLYASGTAAEPQSGPGYGDECCKRWCDCLCSGSTGESDRDRESKLGSIS